MAGKEASIKHFSKSRPYGRFATSYKAKQTTIVQEFKGNNVRRNSGF